MTSLSFISSSQAQNIWDAEALTGQSEWRFDVDYYFAMVNDVTIFKSDLVYKNAFEA